MEEHLDEKEIEDTLQYMQSLENEALLNGFEEGMPEISDVPDDGFDYFFEE